MAATILSKSLAEKLAGVFDYLDRVRRNPLKDNFVPVALSLVFFVGIGFAVYKIYEHRVTGGVGFVQAESFEGLDELRIAEKKQQFFDALRPVIIAENERIADIRAMIVEARQSGGGNARSIASIADDFGVEWSGKEWKQLVARVDSVPMTLVMAQAANESSWGQSRFAQLGNNLFGQWCFEAGCGIVPANRAEGADHEVRKFDSINASVRSYLHNLNTHRAYRELRATRAAARAAGREATGVELAGGLSRYSERGEAYVEEIRSTIRVNRELMLGGTTTAAR